MGFSRNLRLAFSATALLLASLTLQMRAQSQNHGASETSDYRIAGIVVSKADGHVLAHARVTVADVKDLQHPHFELTGDDGSFAFSGLTAGKFTLVGTKRGFMQTGYEQHEQFWTAIVTGAGLDTEHLVLRLTPESYIFGNVLDENGDPVRRASVTLYFASAIQEFGDVVQREYATTDDLGAYEFGPVPPGTYSVAVSAEPWYTIHPSSAAGTTHVDSSLDVAYPITYNGDTADPDGAAPIRVQGGERVQADVHLAPVPALHLILHTPPKEVSGIVLRQPSLFGDELIRDARPQMVSPGLWELTGVPQGEYMLQTMGYTNAGGRVATINATPGEDVDLSGAEALSTLKISAHLLGGKTTAGGLPAVFVLHSKGSAISSARIDEKGNAQFTQLTPGKYEFLVAGIFGSAYGISDVSATGAQVSGHTITIEAGATATLSVSLTRTMESVQGVVQQDGRGVSGTMVVLVPDDPAHHHDLFRRDQSDLDGSFALRQVVPGKYTVIAIADGWDLQWSRPEVIAPYLKKGVAIRVSTDSNGPVKLSQTVEPQPK
jgi:hypothetical protein